MVAQSNRMNDQFREAMERPAELVKEYPLASMLLMFGMGLGNLAWMLALGVLMAVEKNLPIGRRLTRPLGQTLVVAAVAAVAA